MPYTRWVNIFEVGDWDVHVRYKGQDTGASSYANYVRADLLDPAILTCTVVNGEIIIETLDAPAGAADSEQPAIMLVSKDGKYGDLRVIVTQNEGMTDSYQDSALLVVTTTTISTGVLAVNSVVNTVNLPNESALYKLNAWGASSSSSNVPLLRQRGAIGAIPTAVAITFNASPFLSVYDFNGTTGFGTKYANPASLPSQGDSKVDWKPGGTELAMGNQYNSPYIHAYQFTLGVGFGTKRSNPASLPPGHVYSVKFHPSGTALAVAGSSSGTSRLRVYRYNAGGFGTVYSDPGSSPSNNCNDVDFNPAGDAIAVAVTGTSNSPHAWPFNTTTGYGTKYANPATWGLNNGIRWSPDGNYVVNTGTDFVNFIASYPWVPGFGTRTVPGSDLANTGQKVAFTPSGAALIAAHVGAPYTTAYHWSSGFGTKYSNPATAMANTNRDVSVSPNGDAVVFANQNSPYLHGYQWSDGSGFGTKYSNPATLPTGQGYGVAFLK